jgi:hypothetical protein
MYTNNIKKAIEEIKEAIDKISDKSMIYDSLQEALRILQKELKQ